MTVAPRILTNVDTTLILDATGWHLEERGACRGEVCVPIDDATRTDPVALARALNVGLAHDADHGVWALGPQARGRTLSDPQLPALALPDRNGTEVSFQSLRSRRGVLVAWASW